MIEEKVITLRHNDCRNFCSMDVAKGICRKSGNVVMIDSDTCACYKQLPKCKFCANFQATEDGLGVCKADNAGSWAYTEMIAVTCEMFKPA
jgi:4-hydroxyphenylacetate decarboxylase small subunit